MTEKARDAASPARLDGDDHACGCGHDHGPHDQHDHGHHHHAPAGPFVRSRPKVGRNEPCPCGSGKKYKKCCLAA